MDVNAGTATSYGTAKSIVPRMVFAGTNGAAVGRFNSFEPYTEFTNTGSPCEGRAEIMSRYKCIIVLGVKYTVHVLDGPSQSNCPVRIAAICSHGRHSTVSTSSAAVVPSNITNRFWDPPYGDNRDSGNDTDFTYRRSRIMSWNDGPQMHHNFLTGYISYKRLYPNLKVRDRLGTSSYWELASPSTDTSSAHWNLVAMPTVPTVSQSEFSVRAVFHMDVLCFDPVDQQFT